MSPVKKAFSNSFDNYMKGPHNILNYLCVDLSGKTHRFSKYIRIALLFNIVYVTVTQIIYNTINEENFVENISYTSYNVMALGKILAVLYHHRFLVKCVEELREIFPSNNMERKYNLQNYLKYYQWSELLIWRFFLFISSTFLLIPVLQSFYVWQRNGEFPFILSIAIWRPKSLEKSFLAYGISYIIGCISTFHVGSSIAGCDLCLFSCLSQLCLHFDLLSQQIMELKPDENEVEALEQLKAITVQHNEIVVLAKKINTIFSPSTLFSMLASSFILCLIAYLMLEEVSLLIIIKAFLLLFYQSKQVVITCYFGDKLMESSCLINQSLYMHNWIDGSLKYKRQILFMLMNTEKPITLNVARIADISLVTLKQVYGNAYQLFTVFKTA